MPELKGLVTKAGDIWRLKNPGAVNLLSVSRAGSDLTGEVKPVSHSEFQKCSSPMGPGEAGGLGSWIGHQCGGASLGSGLRSLLSPAFNFRVTINTHPVNSPKHSRAGNLMSG